MSWRSLLEFNHDKYPHSDPQAWLEKMLAYFRSNDPSQLPEGVTFFYSRHHSDDCPMGEPPRGWDNNTPPIAEALNAGLKSTRRILRNMNKVLDKSKRKDTASHD